MTTATPTTVEPDETHAQTPPLEVALSGEALVYVVVLLAAVCFRAIELGAAPLAPIEAEQAVAAWSVVDDAVSGGAITSPLAFAGAVLAFAIGGVGDAAARFFPMAAGVGLAAAPLLFRHRLGRVPTLTTVIILAIVPTAVHAARVVGGFTLGMLAIAALLYALERYFAGGGAAAAGGAGAALGLALLADYGTLVVLLAMIVGVGFAMLTDEEQQITPGHLREAAAAFPWGVFAAVLVATVILFGTLFFVVPSGLGAFADQFARFAAGIATRHEDAATLAVVLGVYEPGLLILGVVGAWLASQSPEPWVRFLAGWGVAALLFAILYQGALPGHALWVVVPMAALAGIAVSVLLDTEFEGPLWGMWAFAAITVALGTMILFSVGEHVTSPDLITIPANAEDPTVAFSFHLILAVLWVMLLAALWMSAATAFGPGFPLVGLWLGLTLMAGVMAIGHSVSMAFTDPANPFEVVNVAPAQPPLRVMVDTVEEIGEIVGGDPIEVPITVQGTRDSVVGWALHDYPNVEFVGQAGPAVESVVVITPADGTDPALGSAYVGQDFVVVRRWLPVGLPLDDAIFWVLYHEAPTAPLEESYILWVREDVYRLNLAE